MNALVRWRLVLGKLAENHGINCTGNAEAERVEQLVGFLFEPAGVLGRSRSSDRTGGQGPSQLTVPDWVDAVNELFPQQSKEVMQRELIRRRGIADLMEKPELLEKIESNLELVKTLLTHRELMNPKTRILVRKIIEKVVADLKKVMQVQVETAITGAIRKDRHSPRKVYRNLDLKTTLRRNLQNFDRASGKLFVDQVYFYAAERKKKPWHVIVVVDQPLMAEAAHRIDDRQHGGALRRQLVLDARRRLGVAAARDDALLLEHVQALRQRSRTDAVARVLELGEAARPFGEVVDDERSPFRADQVGRGRDGARTPVVDLHHPALAHWRSQCNPVFGFYLRLRARFPILLEAVRAPTTNNAIVKTVARAIAKPAR